LITAVCVSKQTPSFSLSIPFVSYTENYQPILHRDNNDMNRIKYLTDRYNMAIERALETYPETQHVLLVDHYYLPFSRQLQILIDDYKKLDKVILGASIWYWNRLRIRPWIAYYDTLSVPEFYRRRWWSLGALPKGLIPVTGVGGCWILPRTVWAKTDGFFIPSPPQAGGSRCLDTSGHSVMLDCNSRVWRTHETNPGIPDYPMRRRIIISARQAQRKIRQMIHR
jgi:hypothetical protein